MKTEIAERLSEALRSGNYSQTKGSLNRTGKVNLLSQETLGHCCLGVLSEEAVKDGVIIKKPGDGIIAEFGSNDEFEDGEYGTSFPPVSVSEWAGLVYDERYDSPTIYFDLTGDERVIPKVKHYHKIGDKVLIAAHELNDEFEFSFEDIADLIDNGKVVVDLDLIKGARRLAPGYEA